MRQEFDSDIPTQDQLLMVSRKKKKGRKHQHNPSSRVNERRRASVARYKKMRSGIHAKYVARVRAYWRGDISEYPEK